VLVAGGLALLGDSRRIPMRLEEFFDEYELHLMYAPADSVAALDRAVAGGDVPSGVLRIPATDDVYVARFMGLRPEYAPPSDGICLGFHNELGRYDVVRCRYHVGSWMFEYAMTSQMKAVRIDCADIPGDPFAVANAVAARIFDPSEGVVLKLVGLDRGLSFGRQDIERTGTRWTTEFGNDYVRAHWRDALKWWHEDHTVGFISLKQWGMEKQGVGRRGERNWFREEDE